MMEKEMMPLLGEAPSMGKPPAGWKPPMADISWVKNQYLDLVYGNESEAQKLDLYLPEEGEGPFPLLIHIHGGGFAIGDKRDDHMNAYLKALHHGMAAASIEYRLTDEAIFPAAVLDVRNAIRFLRAHAAEYKLDPKRFIAIGGSAGGNLSAMLAMNIPNGEFRGEEGMSFSEEPFVNLAIDQFGPMNFKTMDSQARANGISHVDHDEPFSPESKYLGFPVQEAPQELVNAANPATYAGPQMTKMLVQHGNADLLVPFEQSEEFVKAVREKTSEEQIVFETLEDANHEDKRFFTDENMNHVFSYIKENL